MWKKKRKCATWIVDVSHDSTMKRLVHTCDMTHSYAWRDSFIRVTCHTNQWVMSRTSMSHVTHVNESCHAHVNESCHTYRWVMMHTSMSHVTHINESCQAYERDMSHISTSRYLIHQPIINSLLSRNSCNTLMSHVTHINESCQTHIN